jgi:membrane dipeptidase
MDYLFIDAHEDLAYSAYTFGRDYTQSAMQIRQLEVNTDIPLHGGQSLLGWPEWQKAKCAVIIGTLFILPKRYQSGDWEKTAYKTVAEASGLTHWQVDYYQRLQDENPEKFHLIQTRRQLIEHWQLWMDQPAASSKPVGIILSMEGAEGLKDPRELEEWYARGLRLLGPVWAGTRYCGGMYESGGFTNEGRLLLEIMAGLGMGLDITHMSEVAALEAIERYEGPAVFASHANCRSLLYGSGGERHLSDQMIRYLAERDGVVGILPYNKFLVPDWTNSEPRDKVTLTHVAAHIDHICQLTGNSTHAAIGTDFDGGFGYPAVPLEINTIAEIQLLAGRLEELGYAEADIQMIFGLNWKRILERTLPA